MQLVTNGTYSIEYRAILSINTGYGFFDFVTSSGSVMSFTTKEPGILVELLGAKFSLA